MNDPDRAARWVALGHRGDLGPGEIADLETAASHDIDPPERAAALGALVRSGPMPSALAAWSAASADPAVIVRTRCADLAPELVARRGTGLGDVVPTLTSMLADDAEMVVVTAAWALGELAGSSAEPIRATAVTALSTITTDHPDALAREAAVAALGSVGDRHGLPAILTACRDKPAVRRRAVLALAPFTGDDVTAALQAALTDRDWQVRQGAEDLLGPEPEAERT